MNESCLGQITMGIYGDDNYRSLPRWVLTISTNIIYKNTVHVVTTVNLTVTNSVLEGLPALICQDQILKLGLILLFQRHGIFFLPQLRLVFSSSFGFALRALSDFSSRGRGTAVMLCLLMKFWFSS